MVVGAGGLKLPVVNAEGDSAMTPTAVSSVLVADGKILRIEGPSLRAHILILLSR